VHSDGTSTLSLHNIIFEQAVAASAMAERGLVIIKNLGLDGPKIASLEEECEALSYDKEDLKQKLAASACEPSHGWGGVFHDVSRIMTLLPAGAKIQEDLRTALGAIINIYTVEPNTANRLGEYLAGAQTSSEGHQCLYNIVTSSPTDQTYQSRNCQCWKIWSTTCVVVGMKRDRNHDIYGHFQLVPMV